MLDTTKLSTLKTLCYHYEYLHKRQINLIGKNVIFNTLWKILEDIQLFVGKDK